MPLFAALPWINVWAIADRGGWAIVDTRPQSPATIDAWQRRFRRRSTRLTVTRVLVTHMHPDHCGMAGWIAERFKARLWMSRLEYLSCRLMAADTGRSAPADGIDFYRAAGWNEEALERYKAKFGSFGEMIYPLPASYQRLSDGDSLRLGGRRMARGGRQWPFTGACLPLLFGIEIAHLRRSGICREFPRMSRCTPRSRRPIRWTTGSIRWPPSSSGFPTMCWCCPPTTARSRGCMRASMS